jgi:hypothetical protein
MRTGGERLIIEPIRAGKRAKVKAAVQRAMSAHEATLRKLAEVIDAVFLDVDDVLLIHEEQLARYGGSAGMRDAGLLQATAVLRRPSTAARGSRTPVPAV